MFLKGMSAAERNKSLKCFGQQPEDSVSAEEYSSNIFFFFFSWCIFFLEVESGFVITDGSELFEGPLFAVPESQPSVSFAPCLSFEGRVVNLVLGFCCGCCRRF